MAQKVENERRCRGLSVDKLAIFSDSSASSIQRLEDGKLCTLATLAKIAAALDCEVMTDLSPRGAAVHAAKDLTPTERRVLRAYQLKSNIKDIAALLKLSVRTVEVHSVAIRTKLGASSMDEALKLALTRNVIRQKPLSAKNRPSGKNSGR